MSAAIRSRVFLVGCVRSGTTLLQSLLAAHSEIASFPETDFFRYLVGQSRERWEGMRPAKWKTRAKSCIRSAMIRAGVGRSQARRAMEAYLKEIGSADLLPLYPPAGRGMRPQIAGFVSILDRMTGDAGK
ncbi:MAG TPA: sulfotransferase, partial [Chthonomonadales bacterium]|nr:sulfotransferase [Chthonomonadales bacterium]